MQNLKKRPGTIIFVSVLKKLPAFMLEPGTWVKFLKIIDPEGMKGFNETGKWPYLDIIWKGPLKALFKAENL